MTINQAGSKENYLGRVYGSYLAINSKGIVIKQSNVSIVKFTKLSETSTPDNGIIGTTTS